MIPVGRQARSQRRGEDDGKEGGPQWRWWHARVSVGRQRNEDERERERERDERRPSGGSGLKGTMRTRV